ncbi:site-2 protease family protein [Streptomyces sp. MAR25Y5]|uniref:site-2 protease family protein n=1 Tax=Streptomyces sp. MAR25Y5 TaxID=2962028 RepID=UPI0020B76FA7|nr:site-2 protease family protein [Streptomyces sp. MAR25Y5]MCP3770554.1 site-2 protease family protein [Streptomyces sp. MAR25Y5]
MDASGGRGQPRSGNDESAERHAGRPADEPTTDEGRSAPAGTTPNPSDDRSGERTADRTPPHSDDAPPRTGGAPAQDAAPPGNGTPEQPSSPVAPVASEEPERPAEARGPRTPHGTEPAGTEPAGTEPAGTEPAGTEPAGTESDRTGTPSGARAAGPPPDGAPAGHRPAPSRPDPSPRPHHPDRASAHSAPGKEPVPHRPAEQRRGGLLMGRPFGVPVYVAPSWFLVAILITWVFGGQIDRVLPELGAASYLVSLFFAVAFYASVLVHELAHTLAALRFKLPVRRIQLQFFGGVSEIEKEAETPGREFVLAFVGPLLSLVLSGLFYLGLLAVDPGSVPGVLLAGLMISNLIVAVFNLLPGLPLDGGRMLRAVVWKITGKPMSGTVAAAWVGRALAISVLVGLPLLTQSGALGSDAADGVGMDTVLDALLAAILAAIIWTGAGNSLRMARLREHLPELRARALTRRAVPVETDTPLSEALRRANAAGARALVVVDPDGTPLSLVREAAIVGVPEHRRPWVAVSGLAQDLTDGMRVSAELAGEELLEALRAAPATEYLVVEATGEIYGVLSAADVERAFVKAMARPA